MRIKIDTKERFKVITIIEPHLTARLAAEFTEILKKGQEADSSTEGAFAHLVVVMSEVQEIEKEATHFLASIQKAFYEQEHSFVYCGLQPAVEKTFKDTGLIEMMNITPTESEAWDILQMEEIERELLKDPDA